MRWSLEVSRIGAEIALGNPLAGRFTLLGIITELEMVKAQGPTWMVGPGTAGPSAGGGIIATLWIAPPSLFNGIYLGGQSIDFLYQHVQG